MHDFKPAAAATVLAALLAGCNTTSPMIPDKVLNLSPSLQIPYEAAAATVLVGVAVWYVVDPLAPTWEIQRNQLANDRYRINLKQKRFAAGGDGEAQDIFRRQGEALVAENGFDGYIILSYSEGVESGPVIGQRVSRGVIQLVHTTTASAEVMR